MTSAIILVVDDEPQIRRVMRTTLTSHGYTVLEAKNGEEALESIRAQRPDLILLDVNMPGMSGLDVCREIRHTSEVPIIMLTVRNSEQDKVLALDAGADDYVVKPFGAEELMARIRAALRRATPAESVEPFTSSELSIDFEKRVVTVKGKTVRLTPKEFELLRHSWQTKEKRWLTDACCRRSGDRITARKPNTSAFSSTSCARKSSPTPASPLHPHRTPGSATVRGPWRKASSWSHRKVPSVEIPGILHAEVVKCQELKSMCPLLQ